MKYLSVIFAVLTVILSILLIAIIRKPSSLSSDLLVLSEINKCPFCYGLNLCKYVKANTIILSYNTLSDFIFNIISVKNVYSATIISTATNDHDRVIKLVLKKLGSNQELAEFDKLIIVHHKKQVEKNINKQLIIELLQHNNKINTNFKTCDQSVNKLFVNKIVALGKYNLLAIWTILHINAEPLIMDLFPSDNGWPVPKVYGACGRLIAMQHCGRPLNTYEFSNWFDRAYLAVQLLQAVVRFTDGTNGLRLYLTDISPDNISVDEQWNVYFVDLENVVLANASGNESTTNQNIVHYTDHVDDVFYTFSPDAICAASISDHNIYSVCHLLLSKNAPWPMMTGGLLHSASQTISDTYQNQLFDLINSCVSSADNIDRFEISRNLSSILKTILLSNNGGMDSKRYNILIKM